MSAISLNIVLDNLSTHQYEAHVDLPSKKAFSRVVLLPQDRAEIDPDWLYVCRLSDYIWEPLQAAGVFAPGQAIALAAFRGGAMADAVAGRPCGMAAVLGLERAAGAGRTAPSDRAPGPNGLWRIFYALSHGPQYPISGQRMVRADKCLRR